MSEEIFDVVDEHDQVIGQAPRSVVHAQRLWHRAASVFVFNSSGQLLLQFRSATKDEYPSCYTSSASGHLSAGEDYALSAEREMWEEIGLSAPLEFLAKFPAGPETANEFTALFRTQTDETPVGDPGEVAALEWMDLPSIRRLIEVNPERFTPPFRTLFDWYCRNCASPPDHDS